MTETSLYRALTEPTRTRNDVFLEVPGAEPITFVDFHARCDALAGRLSDRGVGRGDRVVVQVPKSIDAVALYLAVLRLGAIYVPLNPGYTTQEVLHHVADADPSVYVGDLSCGVPSIPIGDLVDEVRATPPPDGSAIGREPATMLYTSGTTGGPRGAPATSRGLLTNAADLVRRWRLSREDTLLHVLPIFHVHGLFVALNCALLSGCRVVFHERFDAADAIAALSDATVMMAVPTMYTRMLEHDAFGHAAAAGMRLFTSGSAPLPPSVHEAFANRTGHRIVERYGLTETGILTSNRTGSEVAGSVGTPLDNIELRVIGAGGDPDRGPGEVQVRGPSVTPGYWRAPAADEAAFTSDGWFRTGDVGSLDAEGPLRLLGRSKDVIISGGLNVYPAEVETAILDTGLVSEVAVIGLSHPDLGEAVVAVTPHPAAPIDLGSIARFKHPRAWLGVDELPRNAMGKVQKHQLRNRFARHFT